ncbi:MULTISPECIES: class E sortase [unclassified Frankia]|uniref:class E sortase n=1 Tax=unclassified Frankia TaxID=2632575 RepID=UPI00210093AB|nr:MULTISPECIES: class E sortase [unclassified Frankia]
MKGVPATVLRRGPGHMPGTAMPDELGNVVVSGHRTAYRKPFSRLDELKVGDPFPVEVRDRYHAYRVTESEVVAPTRFDATCPMPGEPAEVPGKELITVRSPPLAGISRNGHGVVPGGNGLDFAGALHGD